MLKCVFFLSVSFLLENQDVFSIELGMLRSNVKTYFGLTSVCSENLDCKWYHASFLWAKQRPSEQLCHLLCWVSGPGHEINMVTVSPRSFDTQGLCQKRKISFLCDNTKTLMKN